MTRERLKGEHFLWQGGQEVWSCLRKMEEERQRLQSMWFDLHLGLEMDTEALAALLWKTSLEAYGAEEPPVPIESGEPALGTQDWARISAQKCYFSSTGLANMARVPKTGPRAALSSDTTTPGCELGQGVGCSPVAAGKCQHHRTHVGGGLPEPGNTALTDQAPRTLGMVGDEK